MSGGAGSESEGFSLMKMPDLIFFSIMPPSESSNGGPELSGGDVRPHERHAAKHRTWNTLLQIGLLIIGALYSFFAYQQWRATTKAIRSAETSARIDQRAWVASTGVTGIPEADKEFNIGVGVKNTGKTFATRTEIHGCTRVVPTGIEPTFADEAATVPTSVALLTPGGEYTISATGHENPGKVAQSLVDQLANGEARLFVFGTISYQVSSGVDTGPLFVTILIHARKLIPLTRRIMMQATVHAVTRLALAQAAPCSLSQ